MIVHKLSTIIERGSDSRAGNMKMEESVSAALMKN